MKKDSNKLIAEIQELEEKQRRLQIDLETAEETHKKAREGLVQAGGKTSVDDVTEAHSRVSALREAVSTLDNHLEQKRSELTQAESKEKRQTALDRIQQLRRERDEVRTAYIEMRERANETLYSILKEMRATRLRWATLGVEADRLSVSIGLPREQSSRLGVPQLEPFGVEIDGAFSKMGRLEERRARKARAANAA